MTKILAHTCRDKTYLPLLQNLASKTQVLSGSLHESIFDNYSKFQPEFVILPIQEYTQEFHEFVDTYKTQTNVIIFAGSLTDNMLVKYCDENNIRTICQNKSSENTLTYNYLYDSSAYRNLNFTRENKILTILSNNNEYNHKMLDDILYPKTMYNLVLVNNAEFKHPQNIGSAQFNDLAMLLNHYEYVIDLSNMFYAESSACGIKTIKVDDNLQSNIKDGVLYTEIQNVEEYSIDHFVNDKLLTLIHNITNKGK